VPGATSANSTGRALPKKPSPTLGAVALFSGLLLLLIGSFIAVEAAGHKQKKTAPSPSASQTDASATAINSSDVSQLSSTTMPQAADSSSTPLRTQAETTPAAATTTMPMESPASSGSTTTTLPSTSMAAEATTSSSSSNLRGSTKCYNLFSQLSENPLQKYPNNPESQALGFVTCKLCTSGNMTCTSLLHSGKSELIASHIHLANKGGDGSTGDGPPVINFCGSQKTGLILDGTDYSAPCSQWNANGALHDADMQGALVSSFNQGISAKERVEDIVKRPDMYYFNFHSSPPPKASAVARCSFRTRTREGKSFAIPRTAYFHLCVQSVQHPSSSRNLHAMV